MADDGICPGSCNNSYRRRRALYEEAVREYDDKLMRTPPGAAEIPDPPEAPEIKPWEGIPVWCLKCQGIIRAELAELDDLAALIGAIPPLPKPADDGAGKVGGTPERKSPSSRLDDLEELGEWLRSWESLARDGDDPRPRRGMLATESTTLTAWLYHHFDPLITNADLAADFGNEIRRWHREMARRAAAGQMQRHQKRACPRCNLYTLWLTIGEDYVRCINEDCNRRLTRAEYAALADAA